MWDYAQKKHANALKKKRVAPVLFSEIVLLPHFQTRCGAPGGGAPKCWVPPGAGKGRAATDNTANNQRDMKKEASENVYYS